MCINFINYFEFSVLHIRQIYTSIKRSIFDIEKILCLGASGHIKGSHLWENAHKQMVPFVINMIQYTSRWEVLTTISSDLFYHL